MGRVTFHSPATPLKATAAEAYAFLSDLDNMEKFMPEQVVNWKSDKVSCSFDIKGMAHINLVLGEHVENKLVTVDSGPDNPIELQILFSLVEKTAGSCECTVTLHAELSMMLQMMASGPLQNLVNIMAGKLADIF
jgi:carbon monoxide dehydrogenase subunit G